MKRSFLGLAAVLLAGAAAVGCSMSTDSVDMGAYGSPPGGDFGATQGGVQDMSFARGLVEEGTVPPADAFVVEAMFSEHDLPLSGAACARTLCLRGAMGVAPDRDGAPAAWAQVGLSSTIDPETFERPPLAVIATVDVSSSMGWSYGSSTTSAGAISQALLHAIAAELGDADRFTMVTFGTSVAQPLPWVVGSDPGIGGAIDALAENGSTNMEGGLELAFALGEQAAGGGHDVRVLLFTDVQPNVGATYATTFQLMAAEAAGQGVGLTVFGLGLGMGAEVMKAMSQLRGGNAFSLVDAAAVPAFMEDNWPWLASPIAYDLFVQATPSSGLELVQGYGFPDNDVAPSAKLDVATVFLSKRKGGLLLELAPGLDVPLAPSGVELELHYTDRSGVAVDEAISLSYDGQSTDERGSYLPELGLRRSVPLALLVSAMRDAAALYETNHASAVELLTPALERFVADANASEDEELIAEAEFWPRLLELMEGNAPQGSLYPGDQY